jgi:hypothetical protein
MDHIHPALRHLAVAVDQLVLDPRNARRHDARNLEAIRGSLERFGQRLPIVVQRQGMIVRAGNGRLMAAREMGWTHIAAVVVDEADVEAITFAIADNRSAELADWDTAQLKSILDELPLSDPVLDRMMAELRAEALPEPVFPDERDDEPEVEVRPEFSVLVKCRDEAEQHSLLAALDAEGRHVRALVVGFAPDVERVSNPLPDHSASSVAGLDGLKTRPTIVRDSPISRTPRVMQLEGLFDIPPAGGSRHEWRAALPLDRPWNVGLIVGPSGSGKTTVAREFFGEHFAPQWDWPADRAIVDGFPEGMPIAEITGLLSSVGFSSPPGWLKPFGVLSNGEQFRVHLARTLAERPELCVVDEFTSVVDRTVAQVGSAAVAKTVRRQDHKLVAVSCHYDIIDWLQPDWVLEMPAAAFSWRCLPGRPPLEITIDRVDAKAWDIFRAHHYLSGRLHPAARCFAAHLSGRPAAFASVIHTPGGKGGYWREHRTVCLPDFQGVGIGNALSEFVAAVFASTGKPYRSTTSHPAMIRHRLRSPLWRCTRKPALGTNGRVRAQHTLTAKFRKTAAIYRATASFLWRGPLRREDAKRLGISP